MGNNHRKVHVVSLALLILASLLGMVACQTRPTAGSSQLEVSKSFTPENADHARLVGTLTRPAPKYKELLTDLVSIAFSPDGRLLASGSLDKTIQLWDVISHRHQRTLYDGG